MYTRNCENFDPNSRRLKQIKPSEIFNEFDISLEPSDKIDSKFFYCKDMDQKIPLDTTGADRTNISEVGAE